MVRKLEFATLMGVHRVVELERLARTARQQAAMTTAAEPRAVLLAMADQYATAAFERRAALSLAEHKRR
jgi:hypothetical protein